MKTQNSDSSIITEIQLAIEPSDELPTQADFQLWTNNALQQPGQNEVCIRIVSSTESQQLNRDYRHKDKPTNVLSFYYDDEDSCEGEAHYLGDLVICAQLVATEANQQDKTIQAHWAHLVTHGMLHLQGYDHQSDDGAEIMEALEIKLLQQLGYPNPYRITGAKDD